MQGTKSRMRANRTANGHEPDGYFQNYSEHSRTLRTWLVAYGIGAPVLILNSASLLKLVQQSGASDWIAGLFLAGVCGQILLAFVNKWCAYHVYLAEIDKAFRGKWPERLSARINKWWGLDLSLDFASIVLTAIATGMLLTILLGTSREQQAKAPAVQRCRPAPLLTRSKAHPTAQATTRPSKVASPGEPLRLSRTP